MIEGSGGPYVLSESDIVAVGSMNKFLKGKMYNRCCRGNILLAAATQGLHFKKFLKDFNGNIGESLLEELEIYLKENETDCLERGNSLG